MNPNSPLAQSGVIPAQAGIQQGQIFREADKTVMLSRFAGGFLSSGFPPARE